MFQVKTDFYLHSKVWQLITFSPATQLKHKPLTEQDLVQQKVASTVYIYILSVFSGLEILRDGGFQSMGVLPNHPFLDSP
jgi:hypothetical protein